VADRLAYWLPWRRRRLQRDFSAALAALLDAGLPENEALGLAARATANRVFIRRAEAAVRALGQGEKLTDAVQRLDATGEFRWRLANASHAGSGFLQALSGWHEALDAKAFQQEQTAAQLITAAVVLVYGVVVALVAIAIFGSLVGLIQGAGLW
jgi:type II secretory pathway component PulF